MTQEVHFINRHDSHDRRVHMEGHLASIGYIPRRWQAIIGEEIGASPRYGKNAYACLLSHLMVQQELVKQGYSGWQLIAEDDVQLFGMINLSDLAATAPVNASLLQLTTLTQMYSSDQNDMWIPTRNGYYGTQLYAVNVDSIPDVFARVGICDVAKYLIELPPAVQGGLEVADSYVYCLHEAYLCKYPFAYSLMKLGSTLHSEHLSMHEAGWSQIRKHAEKYANPYIKIIPSNEGD